MPVPATVSGRDTVDVVAESVAASAKTAPRRPKLSGMTGSGNCASAVALK